ncbi:hypothetical protein [Massilia alkalitolerans]|uniref:hypothetical protein n=1 Tax=Massilia alkalitolerans TaxID=286638 RepID=UPI0012EBD966|nr:hypothetical protein [Massilia alkalitolerans]
MTSYSAPSVHVCPGCDAFFLRRRLRTINFFGMRDWSDGAPSMWWRQEPLVQCEACAALFWLDDIEPVGIMPDAARPIGRLTRAWLRWRGDPAGQLQAHEEWTKAMKSWGHAQHVGRVNFDDVVYVLSRSKGVGRDRLLWLRNRIWWGLNDRYRSRSDGSPVPDAPSWPAAAERSNMEVILDILRDGEQQPGSMIQQGELLRLLGRFDEAIALLKAVPADGHSEVRAVKIERLARSGDTQVRELSAPTW